MEICARSAYRGQVTKLCKLASEFLSSEKYQLKNEEMYDEIEEELTSYIQRLTAAHESLVATNKEIHSKGLFKSEDLDKEMEKVAEYEDSAINVLTRLKSRLGILQRKRGSVMGVAANNNTLPVSSATNCSVKLPPLQLKKFDGNYQEWLPFWEQFRAAVHENMTLTSSDKFNYLETVLVGSAKRVIEGFTASEACYDAAISLLQEQYGNVERLIDKHMQQLISLRPIHSKTDVMSLRNLYNSVTACSRSLTALQVPSHQYYVMLKSILIRCLPVELRVHYYRAEEGDSDFGETSNSGSESTSTLSHIGDKQVKGLMRFLKREVESLEKSKAVSITPITKSSYPATATSLVSVVDNPGCLFCASVEHDTKECDTNMSITEKRDILRKNNRCFRCAKRGHASKKCRSARWIACKKCKGKHITSMCDPTFRKCDASASNVNSSPHNTLNLCACNDVLENSNVYLKTARCIVGAPNKQKQLLIRLVIDGGSQHSFIRESLVRKLNLVAIGEVKVSVIPFGTKDKSPYQILKRVKVRMQSQYGDKHLSIEALVVPEICVDVLQAPDGTCSSFQGFQLADSHHVPIKAESGLSVLIGSDFYWTAVTGQQRRITSTLRAVKTIFGWTLQGTQKSCGKITESDSYLNSSSFSLLSTSLHLPVLSRSDLTAFWSLETIGIQSEEAEKHQQAESLIAECISKKGPRYEAKLPWKNIVYEYSVGNNRKEAVRRLESLSRRLSRTPEKFNEYNAAIRKLVADGIAEVVVPEVMNESKRIFYLPHRPVYKEESTTTKMRIVFDASACTDDCPSLNSLLQVGANLLPDVLKVLLNFRLGRFGVVADVEKAFLQILLSEKDRDSHRFIWFSPTKSSEYQDYRMTRVTFGVSCSPFLLTATIQLHLAASVARFPVTCHVLKQSFYVDDLAISVDDEEEGERISREAIMVMEDASMNLRKWNSNSAVIRSSLGSTEAPTMQKVLGLEWYVLSDEITVPLTSVENLLASNLARGSKRTVLQTIAKIFDPLGMLGPTVIKVKILFQAIWKRKLSWDEVLSTDLLSEWEDCIRSILQLKGISIPRSPPAFSSQSVIEIHIFADASMKAYGTVAYIKYKGPTGECNVSFLCAKSRVAPLKMDGSSELTLPKLELTAALIAARLCAYLKKSLKVSVHKFIMWSDSKIALSWIQGEVGRWKPYVEGRVAEIRRHTSASAWKHCRGKENPADLLTRGVSGEHLRTSTLWAQGPMWLTEDVEYNNDENFSYLDDKCKISLLAQVKVLECDPERPLLTYSDYSSWERLLRVTGYVLRFVTSCQGKKGRSTHLSADELNDAETYWLRYLQLNKFSKEVLNLQKEKLVSGDSKIAQLAPFLDQDGLMRVGGRFHCLEESINFKHPILLPPNSYITELIVNHHHFETLHGGVNIVLAEMRRKFWILKGRQLVKKLLRKCVTCQKLWGKPAAQPFGPLPVERLKLSRPFDNVGVDFAGPLYCFNRSKEEMNKVYLMVFTCAAVRAVHLEMVLNLSTESCLMGLRRFIARRGIPSVIFSDNAKTFRRAAMELNDANHPFETEDFQGFLSNKRIRWKFIVERAPWWGGFWERLIRTIKNILKAVIGKAKLSLEQLRTLVIEAEGMVNARPLTYISSDSVDIAPLTPADFLQIKCEGPKNVRDYSPDCNDLQQLWRQRMKYTRMLLKRWRTEYMQLLRSFHHIKNSSSKDVHKGDVVLVFDSGRPRINWRLAVIVDSFLGRDGRVRACEIRFADGGRTRRPVQLLYPLEVSGSSPVGEC